MTLVCLLSCPYLMKTDLKLKVEYSLDDSDKSQSKSSVR